MDHLPIARRRRLLARWCLVALGMAFGSLPAQDGQAPPLAQMPWPPTMPRDYTHEPVTAADWVGPDGIVYPDWTWAGIHRGAPGHRSRGIPSDLRIFARLDAALAGNANAAAFTAVLEQCAADCGAAGGGVIQIPAGVYVLNRPILIRYDRVVIRGAGRGAPMEPGGHADAQETRIIVDFPLPDSGPDSTRIITYPDAGRISSDSQIAMYARPFSPRSSIRSRQAEGQKSHIQGFYLTVTPAGLPPFTVAVSRDRSDQGRYAKWSELSGGGPAMFGCVLAKSLPELRDASTATLQLRVVRRWSEEGVQQEDESVGQPVVVACAWNAAPAGQPGRSHFAWDVMSSALTFAGPAPTRDRASRTHLTAPAKRGDRLVRVALASASEAEGLGYVPGAVIRLSAADTAWWKSAIERDGGGGAPRDHLATLVAVHETDGAVQIEFDQPLQIDLPADEELARGENLDHRADPEHVTTVTTMQCIQECGVQDLVIEQIGDVWFNGIFMRNALNCWVANVRVVHAGRNPIQISGLMNEIRDCEIVDPIWTNNTGQGSGYVHGSSYVLIDHVWARNCRHAPVFNGETGGVVRNSTFVSSDMQWHMSWGRSHLMENVTVHSLPGTGSYGYGAYTQINLADIHGPGMGPRNCIYNCDLEGYKGGIFLGGKTELPLILYNRINANGGPGMILRYHVFNGIILGNAISIQDRFSPAVRFGDPNPESSRLPVHGISGRSGAYEPRLGSANPGNDFIGNAIYGGDGRYAEGYPAYGGVKSSWRRSYGNTMAPYLALPPRPVPPMPSVFAAQLSHPEGFRPADPDRLPYIPDPGLRGSPDEPERDDGQPVVQIAFRPAPTVDPDWSRDAGSGNWLIDDGAPFAEHGAFSYGWVGGRPAALYYEPMNRWNDPMAMNRCGAAFSLGDGADASASAAAPGWRIVLKPGEYSLFVAGGSWRGIERTGDHGTSSQFASNNDFMLNRIRLPDAPLADARRDSWWVDVRVGDDGILELHPSLNAIRPRVTFIQIYPRKPASRSGQDVPKSPKAAELKRLPADPPAAADDATLALWARRLIERSLLAAKSGLRPSFRLHVVNEQVAVIGGDADQALIAFGESSLSVDWKILSDRERADLAADLTRSGRNEDAALAVFWLRAAGAPQAAMAMQARFPGASAYPDQVSAP